MARLAGQLDQATVAVVMRELSALSCMIQSGHLCRRVLQGPFFEFLPSIWGRAFSTFVAVPSKDLWSLSTEEVAEPR